MGTLYAKQELHDKAIKAFLEATRVDPRFEAAFMAMGFAYERKGDLQKALETFSMVITLNPQSAKVHNTVGLIYDKLRLYKQAINEYRIAIKLEPSYANAHFILGQVYENKGIIEKAVAEYEKYVRIHETGAMVDEAKSRIAKIKNMPLEEIEKLLNLKKQDAPMTAAETAKAEAAAAATPAPAQQEVGGVKLTDPKEYLKQVLAKAKAAKNPQAAAPAPATDAKAPTASNPAKPATTPAPLSPEASAKGDAKASVPAALEKPASVEAAPEKPIIPTSPTIAPAAEPTAETPVPTPVAEQPIVAEEPQGEPVAAFREEPVEPHLPAEESASSSIPLYNPDQPLPASALDGYVLDEQEVMDAIVQVDTQSVEQESQVLEAVEAISMSHPADDELLEDSQQAPPTPVPMPMATPPPRSVAKPGDKSSIKHGFF
jgi:hypothetical protein